MKKPKLEELTLRERIGQTGIAYPAMDLKDPDVPFGIAWSVGGLKMAFVNMDFTPRDDLKMTADAYAQEMEKVNACRKVPVLSAMDCIFGIDGAFYEMSPIVSAPMIGAANDEALAFEAGKMRGLHMRRTCTNWWWGPNVDLPARWSEISYGRLYSDDPERVARLARAEMLAVSLWALRPQQSISPALTRWNTGTPIQICRCCTALWKAGSSGRARFSRI